MQPQYPSSAPDPYPIDDYFTFAWNNPNGLTPRNPTINTGIRNLVLLWAGQSLCTNSLPSLYIPVNSNAVDQLSVYDGAFYPIADKMLGCSYIVGPGSLAARVADKFITNGIFDRVIVANVGVDSTLVENWVPGAQHDQRIPTAIRRLKARGIVPGMPNVTFAKHWMIGETDALVGTSTADYQTRFNARLDGDAAAGFVGRTFITLETYRAGVIYPTIRAAQAGVVNGTTVFQSGDIDTLTAAGGNRDGANLHLSDVGGENAATLIYNAMHASGAPF